MRSRKSWQPWVASVAGVALSGLLLTGCANFETKTAGQTFTPTPELTPKAGPEPQLPGQNGSGTGPSAPQTPQQSTPPPNGCVDFDKAVVETCLDTAVSVVALPGSTTTPTALVAERKTGRILRVAQDTDPVEVARLSVDGSTDGGLTSIALSPTYQEDQLIFAFITTNQDNQIVRIAPGSPAKPILTGLPKGPRGNRGALLTDGKGALLAATGDAGNPAGAADGNSLAGKVLRIDTGGKAAAGNPTSGSPILAAGLHSPSGLCKSADSSRLWVTDRTDEKDAIYRIQPGSSLAAAVWTWPDKPGVAGCLDNENSIMVATSLAGNIQNLPITPQGAAGGKPNVILDGNNGTGYGKLSGLDPLNAELAFASTVNKDGGKPVSSDDRVVVIPRQPASGGSGDKD